MRELVLTSRFERSFNHVVSKHPELRNRIEPALRMMADDLDDPRLKTHHLSGQLEGLFACAVSYDCRIGFSKQKSSKASSEALILIDIGTHDEVY